MKRARLLMLGTAVTLAAAAAPVSGASADLKSSQIRATISGKYVTDDHHWAHHYLEDGRLTRVDKGRIKPGRWSVQGDRLCLLMPELGDEPVCYAVRRSGTELLYLDRRGYAVWQGAVRDKAHTPLFEGVKDPPGPPAKKAN